MSLGFAVADDFGIHVAIESAGTGQLMAPLNKALDSKIIELQDGIIALATGWLYNWLFAKHGYVLQKSPRDAAAHVTTLLKQSVAQRPNDPDAFGLVCGYEGRNPVIYRISASRSKPDTFDCNPVDAHEVQPIGGMWEIVTQVQRQRLSSGDSPRCELIRSVLESVLEEVPHHPEKMFPPIQCRALLMPGYQTFAEQIREPIKCRAYKKYLDENRRDGRHLTHWLSAKSDLGFSSYSDI